MKTKTLTLLLAFLSITMFGQQWTNISNGNPSPIKTTLVSSTESEITVSIDVPGFYSSTITTPRGEACVIELPKAITNMAAGDPNLPMIAIPAIIGDKALMEVKVMASDFVDFEGVEIAPSKGDFPRTINPEDVPYTYGEAYRQDAFFPAQLATLDEPYIHRDVRGQNIMVTPILYNPMTKTLRVYKHLVVRMAKTGEDSRNIIENRSRSFALDPEFDALYESRYINYKESMAKYTPIAENGELLIICHDAFMTAMEPFVTWKKQIGRPTTMVGTSATGTNESAIKSYITNYYASHPNLTDILLVGDVGQIPGSYVSAGSGYSGYSGYGDLPYGQLAGNDSYNEVLVGRFCCETEAQVTNHVNKVLNYERDLDENATWLSVGQGVSTSAGSGGHFNEDDYQHIDNIRNDLLGYNYTNVYRDYQNVSGTTASNASAVSQHINQGVSIINYCNHGSETSWGVFNYSNSHVNALTNDYKLPYIISVACLNGKYDHSSGCFAEAWMRATNNSNGNPTGAIGGMFSYISQPWVPPMYGQDEMIDILVESYSNNIRRTMGGVSVNGNMKVLDQGATQNANKGTYNCWILFGDPTLTLRNAVPTVMNVSCPNEMSSTANTFTVTASNGEGALATLTMGGEILGSATITSGTATISFTAPGQAGQAILTVFGYNMKTYYTTINVTTGGGGTTPTAPTNLTATIVDNYDVQLQWNAANPASSYKVYRDDNMIAQNITGTNYLDQELEPGTYSYQVSTVYNGIESPRSAAVSVTIIAPLQVTASANPTVIPLGGNSRLTAAVTGGAGTTTFVWAPASTLSNPNIMSPTATPTETTTYTVTVSRGEMTVTDQVTVQVVIPPTNVEVLLVPDKSNAATISWTAASLATTYNLYDNGEMIESGITLTQAEADNLASGNHCFTVTAVFEDVESPESDEACIDIFICIPPADFEATYYWENNVFGTQLVWMKDQEVNFSLNKYYILRGTSPENMETIDSLINVPYLYRYEYVDENVDPGEYFYQIGANYGDNGTCYSEVLAVAVTSASEAWDKTSIYPNPTTGMITVESSNMSRIVVVNSLGQTVYQAIPENNVIAVDLSQYGKGIYLIQLYNEKGMMTKKVIVE